MNQIKFLINLIDTATLVLTEISKTQLGRKNFLITSHGKDRKELLGFFFKSWDYSTSRKILEDNFFLG